MTDNINQQKPLPNDVEAEKSVLGAIILDNSNLHPASEVLRSKDFYKPSHRVTFEAMQNLMDEGDVIDAITLKDELNKNDNLEKVGDISYLATLTEGVPKSTNIRHYAEIVRDKSMLRELIHSSSSIISSCIDQNKSPEQIFDEAESSLYKLAGDSMGEGFVSMDRLARESMENIEELAEKKELITGIPTGFDELDEKTCGFQDSNLVIIAARPSMGKTSFALNAAANAGIKNDFTVGIFSLEMSKKMLFQRLLCSEAMIDMSRLETGYLSEKDWEDLTEMMATVSDSNIFIDDTPAISLAEMKAKSRRLDLEQELDMLIVDYLQLMQTNSSFQSKNQEVTFLSQGLKGLAKELDIPVVALSQLSRAPEKRTNHRPRLSDLRESGSIEQDADVVIFLYRAEMYDDEEAEEKGKAEIIIGKQRNGPTGKLKLAFLEKYTRFENLADNYEF